MILEHEGMRTFCELVSSRSQRPDMRRETISKRLTEHRWVRQRHTALGLMSNVQSRLRLGSTSSTNSTSGTSRTTSNSGSFTKSNASSECSPHSHNSYSASLALEKQKIIDKTCAQF